MCLYPKLIDNPKYRANKKNRGNVPPVPDDRVKYVPIGCGNCIECVKQKRKQWQVRLLEDLRHNRNAYFVTLTFSDESYYNFMQEFQNECSGYALDNAIAIRATRLFLERWRKKYKRSCRHWLVTELGQKNTENIHMHGLVWCDSKQAETLQNIWQYGRTDLGSYVNEKTVNYIVKYVSKKDALHKTYTPIILTSPGIGRGYVDRDDAKRNKFNGDNTREYYVTRTGHRMSLPIYWRNKLYNEHQREQLWLAKLDKQERWVCGERVDVSTEQGMNEYLALLNHYRARNERLGYGSDIRDWEREQYERQLREIKQKTRAARATKKLQLVKGQV